MLVDEMHGGARDAALGLDVDVAVLADLDGVGILASDDGAAVSALEPPLFFERTEVLAYAVLRHMKTVTEILDAHLAVACKDVKDGIMAFYKKHILASVAIGLSYFFQFYPKEKSFSSPKFSLCQRIKVNFSKMLS